MTLPYVIFMHANFPMNDEKAKLKFSANNSELTVLSFEKLISTNFLYTTSNFNFNCFCCYHPDVLQQAQCIVSFVLIGLLIFFNKPISRSIT